jgi:protein-S-isoprenylcysteine O-methyltransferase Ste14
MDTTALFSSAIGSIWIIFLVVWALAALTAKRDAPGTRRRWFIYRLGVLALVYILIRYTDFFNLIGSYRSSNLIIEGLGVVLTVLGVGVAIWARLYLGRNWGMPMSQREDPELVTTGPYAYVRHPIYSGILLALVGSALTLGASFAIFFLVSTFYFLYSAPIEEKNMAQRFPDAYPAYKKRTKMLIPFLA